MLPSLSEPPGQEPCFILLFKFPALPREALRGSLLPHRVTLGAPAAEAGVTASAETRS